MLPHRDTGWDPPCKDAFTPAPKHSPELQWGPLGWGWATLPPTSHHITHGVRKQRFKLLPKQRLNAVVWGLGNTERVFKLRKGLMCFL